MPIHFVNETPIDLSAIEIMGVSVKEGPSPIGFFGTGLKFAIATLLRTGHSVTLHRDGEEIRFETVPETIRGQEFQRIVMRRPFAESPIHVPLGFTTQLGRTWEPWQAYRELRSNAIDEGGATADHLPPGTWGTIFCVAGEGVEAAHRVRGTIFLESEPLTSCGECSVHVGGGRMAFYRGVRAAELERHALHTYNVKDTLELTEDRTVKHSYMIPYYAGVAIASSENEDMIDACVMADRATFEGNLAYNHGARPTDVFLRVVGGHRRDAKLNIGALALWEKHADRAVMYEATQLDEIDEDQIARALVLTRRLGCDLERGEFTVVESIGSNIYGRVWRGQILISRMTIDKGPRFIASTLYEEWLHKACGHADESRDLQNLLLDRLLGMTERVIELEKRNIVS